ncbi:MAG: acetylglutamate kinase [Bdellovibrionaceae bacterium]|nr:acetylglutamate kinase [Pseudobdellovibrionaceae bacterium]
MMKKRIVIKLGGSTLDNPSTLSQLAGLVRGYQKRQYQVVLVHGGGPAVNAELTRRQITWSFIEGQRQTTPEMMAIIEDVLGRQVNGALVQSLVNAGLKARGHSGTEDLLWCRQASPELMRVGQVEFVNQTVLERWLCGEGAPVPVIAPVGLGLDLQTFNINADWAAAKIAIALKAETLIFLTDQEGILDQHRRLVVRASPFALNHWIASGVIHGGMLVKTKAMIEALQSGVEQVRVLNAATASQLLTDKKIGTLLTTQKVPVKKGAVHEYAS